MMSLKQAIAKQNDLVSCRSAGRHRRLSDAVSAGTVTPKIRNVIADMTLSGSCRWAMTGIAQMRKGEPMDRQKIERSIKGLSEWQMHVQAESDIDRDISTAIDALKAQLSQEGTTSDLISKTETAEHLRRVLDVTVPVSDYDEGYVDGVEFGLSTVSTMTTIQPELTDEQVIDYCRKKGYKIVADYLFNLLSKPEPKWIPVSERLPEEPGYYITSNEYNGVGEDFYYDGHFWNADKNAYSVIAWMPKPKAYTK